jgi:hypothetical protein
VRSLVPADVELTRHCVIRFRERCCPGLRLNDAKRRLKALVEAGRIVEARPEWISRTRVRGVGRLGFVVIENLSPRLMLPVVVSNRPPFGPVAVTCLAEEGRSDR